ncbi:hypothetical protein CBFG_01240 [Clostridiales bacterium 1_7_47FAA]|nr:hypothetical protein CBFG_01240 [Clostridiales bacterium 1_7_47FAA]
MGFRAGAGRSLRLAGARTQGSEGAASKILTSKKTGDRCYSLRNPEGLSQLRAPWTHALMHSSTPAFLLART